MKVGDIVTTKKRHPCGENRWEIVRTGAEWKIKCVGCGRMLIVSPDELKKRLKHISSEEL